VTAGALLARARELGARPAAAQPAVASPELVEGDRALAVERVLSVPLFAAIGYMQPVAVSAAFAPCLAGAMAWELATGWLVFKVGRPRVQVFPMIFFDIGLMALAVWLTGRAHSEIRFLALLTVPVISYSMQLKQTVALVSTFMLVLLLPLLSAVADGQSGAGGDTVRWLLLAAFVALFTIMSVWVRERSSDRLRLLADARQRLVSEMAQAEERERGRVSQLIHDDALQLLLAASQDLAEAQAGDETSLPIAGENLTAGLVALRDALRALHPTALAAAGLPASLEHHTRRVADGAGLDARIEIDPAAGSSHDALLFAIARELVTNVAKHAQATRIDVRLVQSNGQLELTVADDGAGIADGRRDQALRAGHVGLASCVERVEANGGKVAVASAPAQGTTIRIALPIDH
jgi:two-component system NarL family sensor kinase